MADATERLVNLALFLSHERAPASARDIREQVEGYPSDQDEPAFLRMFERDKKELRAAGLVIESVEESSGASYVLDRAATFQDRVDIPPEEVALLRAVGSALLDDPAFPFGDALATALAKLSAPPIGAVDGRLADEDPRRQGALASELAPACVARKRVAFEYEDARGRGSSREVEPYGLFLRDGRWYLVGRDIAAQGERVFAIRRMHDVEVESRRPGTPDFDAPDDLDVAAFACLPFQYGEEPFEAALVFEPDFAWRAPVLSEGRGSLVRRDDGSIAWHVEARDTSRLARWVVENGPGIALVEPAAARKALADGLAKVVDEHG